WPAMERQPGTPGPQTSCQKVTRWRCARQSRALRRGLTAARRWRPARYGACELARPDCRIFAPGWYCEDRDLVVLPTLLLDGDFEPDGDDEPNGDDEADDDY